MGVIPGFGGTQRLPRLIGLGRAMELLATGSQIRAEEAFRIGLVNHVVPQDELLSSCQSLANTICAKSAYAISLGKQAMRRGTEMDLDQGLSLEAVLFGLTFAAEDQKEGMTAFLEKRKAQFQ